MEADLGYCPGSYYNMLSLIWRYICMLTVLLFGAGFGYLIEVQGVFQAFADKSQGVFQAFADKSTVYELMTGELVAETLWQIFIDAPACFSTTQPALPQSQLYYQLRGSIQSCTLRATINCVVDWLLGQQPESTVVSQQSSVGGSRGSRWSGGGSTMSTLSGPSATSSKPPPPVCRRQAQKVNIMMVFRDSYPIVDMSALMCSQKLTMAMLRRRAIKQ
jgi:hypothetical protein